MRLGTGCASEDIRELFDERVRLRQGDLADLVSTKPQIFPQGDGSGNQQLKSRCAEWAFIDRSYVNPVLNLTG